MRWMRILVLALALSFLGLTAPDGSSAAEQDNPRVKMVSKKDKNLKNKKKLKKGKKGKKKRIKRVKKKKPVKKKAQGFKEPKWSVGVRGAMMPAGDMNREATNGTTNDLDPRIAFGLGLITQYRIFDKPSIYILGEFNHWWHELKEQQGAEKNSVVTVSAGVRINVWGQATKARNRVFVKALVGYTYFATNNGIKGFLGTDASMNNSDRSGIYFGGGLGYEYLFKAVPISVFVDTGVYNHNFLDTAKGEKEASLLTWEVGAGLLYHF